MSCAVALRHNRIDRSCDRLTGAAPVDRPATRAPPVLDRIQGRARAARPWEDPRASDHGILGVEPHASPQAIRRAYLDLVRSWHPDRFPNASTFRHDAELATKRINEAYEALIGRTSRRERIAHQSRWWRPPTSPQRDAEASLYRYPAWDSVRSARHPAAAVAFILILVIAPVLTLCLVYALDQALPIR
jgi:preprotein translocase subunit Sec63